MFDLFLKAIGTALVIVAAFQATGIYERDVAEKLLDQKLKFANDALITAGQIATSEDWKGYSHALDVFGVAKHGPGASAVSATTIYPRAMTDYWNFCAMKYQSESAGPFNQINVYNDVDPKFRELAEVFHKKVFDPHPLKIEDSVERTR